MDLKQKKCPPFFDCFSQNQLIYSVGLVGALFSGSVLSAQSFAQGTAHAHFFTGHLERFSHRCTHAHDGEVQLSLTERLPKLLQFGLYLCEKRFNGEKRVWIGSYPWLPLFYLPVSQ